MTLLDSIIVSLHAVPLLFWWYHPPAGARGVPVSMTEVSLPGRASISTSVNLGMPLPICFMPSFKTLIAAFRSLSIVRPHALQWYIRSESFRSCFMFPHLEHSVMYARDQLPLLEIIISVGNMLQFSVMIDDEIEYLPLTGEESNLFFQFVSSRNEKHWTIYTSNKGFSEWGEIIGDSVMASAVLDRILHLCIVVNIRGDSYRLKERLEIDL